MKNYVLKNAVSAGKIEGITGNTVYFEDGTTLDVDNAFITQQLPKIGDYVVDGEVMIKGEFESLYVAEDSGDIAEEDNVDDGSAPEAPVDPTPVQPEIEVSVSDEAVNEGQDEAVVNG